MSGEPAQRRVERAIARPGWRTSKRIRAINCQRSENCSNAARAISSLPESGDWRIERGPPCPAAGARIECRRAFANIGQGPHDQRHGQRQYAAPALEPRGVHIHATCGLSLQAAASRALICSTRAGSPGDRRHRVASGWRRAHA